MAADMAAFGYSPEAVAAAMADVGRRTVEDAGLLIHPDNGNAVRLFLVLQTQWRTQALTTLAGTRAIRTGLDYGVLEATARLEALALTLPEDFRRLRMMEAEALAAWSKARA